MLPIFGKYCLGFFFFLLCRELLAFKRRAETFETSRKVLALFIFLLPVYTCFSIPFPDLVLVNIKYRKLFGVAQDNAILKPRTRNAASCPSTRR